MTISSATSKKNNLVENTMMIKFQLQHRKASNAQDDKTSNCGRYSHRHILQGDVRLWAEGVSIHPGKEKKNMENMSPNNAVESKDLKDGPIDLK